MRVTNRPSRRGLPEVATIREVSGSFALVARFAHGAVGEPREVVMLLGLDAAGRIATSLWVLNPHKLGAIAPI